MARPRKYATEEERKAAKKEYNKRSNAKHKDRDRGKVLEWQGWQPSFCGIDGESFLTGNTLPDGSPEQAYCLLLRNDQGPLYNPKGISTFEALAYLTYNPPKKTALVGYFLNFDFEWILKDITQEEYKALQHGEIVELYDGEFFVQWFVGKKLVIYRLLQGRRSTPKAARKLNKHYSMTTIQDVQGFFQTSFLGALEKWGFYKKNKGGSYPEDTDPRILTIVNGKAARGGFEHADKEDVSYYNKCEMELLEELMIKVYHSFKGAYEAVGLQFKVNSQTWSGPGVFANDFLKQTRWPEQHVEPTKEFIDFFADKKESSFGNDISKGYPFSLAYYGGRIELAGIGHFNEGFNYDINSAYPYALSLLPSWQPDSFQYVNYIGLVNDPDAAAFLSSRFMGMYTIRFNFPEGWTWYPFPCRDVQYGAPNVFYPRQGFTHIMSPELFAVLDTLTEEEKQYVEVVDAIIIQDTEGYGDALKRMEPGRLCNTARMTLKLADVRLQLKKAKADAEKALKLILNSLYGKTVQQVGSHKYYSDFASAWITSTCRALLWRAMAPEKSTDNVIMSMTDGIYSRVPLPFAAERLTSILGDWEETTFKAIETFKPGIYRYDEGQGWKYKVRGFLTPTKEDKERLFSMIWQSMTNPPGAIFEDIKQLENELQRIEVEGDLFSNQILQDIKRLYIRKPKKGGAFYEEFSYLPSNVKKLFKPYKHSHYLSFDEGAEALGLTAAELVDRLSVDRPVNNVHNSSYTQDLEKALSQLKDYAKDVQPLVFPARQFLTRNLCLAGWKREPFCRQFYTDLKDITSELKAKREPNPEYGWLIPEGKESIFFFPKRAHDINYSIGYSLQFEDVEELLDDLEVLEAALEKYDANIGAEELYFTDND